MQFVKLKHASVSICGAETCSVLAELVQSCELLEDPSWIDLELAREVDGLHLTWNRALEKPLKFHLDFEKLVRHQRSFPAPKQGAFNQALGKKTKSVIDATGGWAGDAMLMCMQGYQVTIIERLPIMVALIKDALLRLAESDWAVSNAIVTPVVLSGDAATLLPELSAQGECVYLDPMFPEKKKKKSASNKQMQLLQWLAGADSDANNVAAIANQYFSRLAVKRPDHAEPLLAKPSTQFSSKLVHYDVYL